MAPVELRCGKLRLLPTPPAPGTAVSCKRSGNIDTGGRYLSSFRSHPYHWYRNDVLSVAGVRMTKEHGLLVRKFLGKIWSLTSAAFETDDNDLYFLLLKKQIIFVFRTFHVNE